MRQITELIRVVSVLCWLCFNGIEVMAQESKQADATDLKRLLDRQSFIPLDELDVVVGKDQAGVVLQRAEFDRLHRAALEQVEREANSFKTFVISNADYAATIDGDFLVLDATIDVQVFQRGWTEIGLSFGNLSLLQATVNDAPAKLGRRVAAPRPAPATMADKNAAPQKPGPQQTAQQPAASDLFRPREFVLFLNQPGKAIVKLKLAAPLESVGSDKAARFHLVKAAGSVISVTVPAERHLKVHGRTLDRPAPVAQAATYRLPVGGHENLLLLFTGDSQRQSTDSLTFASTGYGVQVAPGEVSWTAVTKLQVYGTPLTKLRCAVPKTLEITDIESTGLEAWELADNPEDAQSTLLTLNYRQPIDAQRDITFRGVMATTVGAGWVVPPLSIKQVTSHIGRLVVKHGAGVRVRVLEAQGVRSAVANGSAGSLSYDIWREGFRLVFETQTHQREVLAQVKTTLDLNQQGVSLTGAITLATLFAPLFDIEFGLPPEWKLRQVMLGNEEVDWQTSTTEDGSQRFQIKLKEPLSPGGSVGIGFVAERSVDGWPIDIEPVELPLPNLFLPQAAAVEGGMVVRADADLDLVMGETVGLDPTATSGAGERLGFAYEETNYSGQLKISRQLSQLVARTLTFSRLDREEFFSYLQADLEISGSGVRELKVALPAAAGSDLRFFLSNSGAQIVEQSAADPEGEQRVWTLRFDRRVLGAASLHVAVSQKRAEEKRFVVPAMQLPQADRVFGFVAIEAAADQQLEITALDAQKKTLGEIDPIDLPPFVYTPQQRLVAVYRHATPGYAVSLSEERFDRVAVPTAVVFQANYQSVLSRTGEMQHQAQYDFSAVGAQALRLKFNQDAGATEDHSSSLDLWAVLLDGKPIEVRVQRSSDAESYLVPLPVDGQVDARRQLTLFYRNTRERLASTTRFQQSPPALAVVQSDGTEQPLSILLHEWKVNYPEDTLVTESSGAFEPAGYLDSDSLLAELRNDYRPPTWNQLMERGFFVGIAIVTVLVTGLLLSRYGFGRLGCFTVLLGIPVLLVSLLLPSVQSSREAKSVRITMRDDVGSTEYGGIAVAPMAAPLGQFENGAPAAAEAMAQLDETVELKTAAEKPRMRVNVTKRQMDAKDSPVSEMEDFKEIRTQEKKAEPLMDEALDGDGKAVGFPPPAEPLNAPQADGGKLAVPSERGTARKAGLLSLSLALEVPPGSRQQAFRYFGLQGADAGLDLDLEWRVREDGHAGRLMLVTVIALVAWLLSRRSARLRWGLVALGITVPLGIISIAPVRWHVLLDGLFLGTIAAQMLWLLRGAVAKFGRTFGVTAAAGLLVTLGSLSSGTSVVAQDKAPEVKSPQIIVPYEDSKDPLKAERVVLSRDLFVELWNLAHPDQAILPPSPVAGMVVAARYDAEVRAGSDPVVSVVATLMLQNFRNEQVAVPIPVGAIAINEARLNDKPAAVRARQQGTQAWLDVVLETPGSHRLELRFDVPAQQQGSVGQFTLPQFSAPAGEVIFKLPAVNSVARVNGSTSAYRRVERDGTAFVAIPVEDAQPLTIAWRPPQEQAAVGAIINVDGLTSVLVDDAGLTHQTLLRYSVPQGAMADAAFELPKSLLVRKITGPQLVGWELNETGDVRKLRVFFNPPVKDTTELKFELFQDVRVGDEPVAVTLSTIQPRDVTRESGTLTLHASDDFSIRSPVVTGGKQVEASNSRTNLTGAFAAARLAFAQSARPFQLQTQLVRQAPEAIARSQHVVQVSRRRIHLASRFDFDLRRVARPSLSLKIPDAYHVSEVAATSMSDWYVSPGDGTNPRTLTIDLKQPLSGPVQVVMQGYLLKGPEDLIADVPLPQPLELSRQQASVGVWFDAGYNATPTQTEGWKAIGSNQLPPELQSRMKTPAPFAFVTEALDVGALGFDVLSAQPKFNADGVVIATVTDTSLDYSFAMRWRISGAAADKFYFATPKEFLGKVKVKGAGLRDVTSEVVGDFVRWKITLRDAIADEYFAIGLVTLPPAQKKFSLPELRFDAVTYDESGSPGELAPLEQQRQFAILVNQSEQQLKPLHDRSIEVVPIDDIPLKLSTEHRHQAAEVLRIRNRGKQPTWELRKFEQQAGAPASVNLADLTLAIAPDGTWRGKAEYTIRNRRRQFLALRLGEARLLSVFVGGQPSRTVLTKLNEQIVHLIPLPKSNESDLSFNVKLVYSGHLSERLPNGVFPLTRDFELPAPDVVGLQESPTLGIPVARTVWLVHLPHNVEAMLVDDPQRSNVEILQGHEIGVLKARSMLQDAEQMLSVLGGLSGGTSQTYNPSSGGNNLKQQGLAISNLKRLSESLNSYQSANNPYSGSGSFSDSQTQREFDRDNGRVQEQLVKNRFLYEQLERSWAVQQQPIQNPSLVQPDANRAVIDSNNDSLLNFNAGNAIRQFGLDNSEDTNRNGMLDPGEDINGNGILDAVQVVIPDGATNQSAPVTKFNLELKESSKPTVFFEAINVLDKAAKTAEKGKASGEKRQEPALEQRQAVRSQLREQNSGLFGRSKALKPQTDAPNQAAQNGAEMNGQPQAQPPMDRKQAMQQSDFAPPTDMPGLPPMTPAKRPLATGGGAFGNGPMPQGGPMPGGFDGGMGMGGLGGGGGAIANEIAGAEGINAGVPVAPVPAQPWTQVGGLSLEIELPSVPAQGLLFSKVGGTPKLTLRIQSQQVVSKGFGTLWAVCWIAVGVLLAVSAAKQKDGTGLRHLVEWCAMGLGLLAFMMLQSGLQVLGCIAFLVGLVLLARRYVKRRLMARGK